MDTEKTSFIGNNVGLIQHVPAAAKDAFRRVNDGRLDFFPDRGGDGCFPSCRKLYDPVSGVTALRCV